MTDEVKNYVSIDVLGIYLRDFGIQLGYAMEDVYKRQMQSYTKRKD